jgi:hypothetical protein
MSRLITMKQIQIQIWILLFIWCETGAIFSLVCRSRCGSWFLFDADADPDRNYHFDADLDPAQVVIL